LESFGLLLLSFNRVGLYLKSGAVVSVVFFCLFLDCYGLSLCSGIPRQSLVSKKEKEISVGPWKWQEWLFLSFLLRECCFERTLNDGKALTLVIHLSSRRSSATVSLN
jgi:hypothetical protein